MLRELAVNTRVIYYLMALLGMIGVLAKAVNQQTLNQMLKAAGNMSNIFMNIEDFCLGFIPGDRCNC